MDDDLYLIKQKEIGQNEDGYPIKKEACREVFAEARDPTTRESFRANREGVDVSIVFRMNSIDYEGERLVKHEGKRYAVEQTSVPNAREIFLYCSDVKVS